MEFWVGLVIGFALTAIYFRLYEGKWFWED